MSPFVDWIETTAPNPYHRWFVVVLVLLSATFVVWRWKRPTPRPILRVIAAVAAITAVIASIAQSGADPDEWTAGYLMTLKSTAVLAGSLVLELLLMPRRPDALARAIAQYRSARTAAIASMPAPRPTIASTDATGIVPIREA